MTTQPSYRRQVLSMALVVVLSLFILPAVTFAGGGGGASSSGSDSTSDDGGAAASNSNAANGSTAASSNNAAADAAGNGTASSYGGDSGSSTIYYGDPAPSTENTTSTRREDVVERRPVDPVINFDNRPSTTNNTGGSTGGGGSVSLAASPNFNCTPSSVVLGQTVLCTWACDVGGGDTSSAGIGFSTGGGSSGTSQPITPSGSGTTFGVQCYPSGRQTTQTVSVIAPTLSISATPSRVRYDTASTIVWSATDVTSCTVSGPNISANTTSGSRSTGALRVQSIYTLTCQTSAGPRSASATVYITPRVCEPGTAACPE